MKRVSIFWLAMVIPIGCGNRGESHARPANAVSAIQECGYCGMHVENAAPFSVSHGALRFDSVKCFLGYTLEHTNVVRNTAQAREYYSGHEVALGDLTLVADSDVMGPMGKDFIAVRAADVDRFVHDHGGHRLNAPPERIGRAEIMALFAR